MFKLVVLSALVAAAVAEPGLIYNPLEYYNYPTTFTAPATTTYVQQASSYVPAPILSSSLSIPHFIKKRSAPILTAAAPIIAPAAYSPSYIAPAPLSATYPSAIIPGGYYANYPSYYAGYPAALPFIKK